jgi:hypothetical protein
MAMTLRRDGRRTTDWSWMAIFAVVTAFWVTVALVLMEAIAG